MPSVIDLVSSDDDSSSDDESDCRDGIHKPLVTTHKSTAKVETRTTGKIDRPTEEKKKERPNVQSDSEDENDVVEKSK